MAEKGPSPRSKFNMPFVERRLDDPTGPDKQFKVDSMQYLLSKGITDENLLAKMSVNDQMPKTALIIRVNEIYLLCAKAIARSDIWNPDKLVRDYSTREMFAEHVGKSKKEFSVQPE